MKSAVRLIGYDLLLVLGCVSVLLPLVGADAATINHLYIVAGQDPSTSMVVQYHTAEAGESVVRYDTEPEAEGNPLTQSAKGSSHQIPGLEDGRHVHAVELTGLSPATTYYFETGHGKSGSFRTLPNDGSSVRTVHGGDMSLFPLESQMLKVSAKENPDVAIIGGDIAYANGELKNAPMWDVWLERWEHFMVRPDGAMVPMILAIGNHEVNDLEDPDPAVRSPFYFGYFAQGGKSYFARQLGPNARILAIDSGHITPHADQVEFLKTEFESASGIPLLFTTYHVPLFPTHRDFNGGGSVAGREHWQPLFDEYGLSIGFEHHDHTFKRTKPIRGGEVHEGGVVYLGDGSMGVAVREVNNGDAWYVEKAASKAHVWVVDISSEGAHCRAVDHLGQVFDEATIAARKLVVN